MRPDYGYIHFRSRRYVYGFMLLAAFSLLLWIFLGPFHLPISSPRVLLTIALAVLSLASSLYYLPKYKAYRFANKSGILAFDVIVAGPEKARCQEFADLLAQTIQCVKLPRNNHAPALDPVQPANPSAIPGQIG